MVAQMQQDMFPYNCFLSIGMPRSDEELELAKEAYDRARSQ